jgi:putative tryptophan/tyrosine transport system substrate-binding protein
MNKLSHLFILIVLNLLLAACNTQSHSSKKIGIIVPLQHKALDQIAAGFTETLQKLSPYPVEFKIANAQNDLNLQRAIIQQMQDNHYAMIVPIGSVTTEMTLAMVKTIPVISLASSYSEKERTQQHPCHTAIVHDDISPAHTLKFAKAVYPHMTHLTLIHSTSEKIFPDVKVTIESAKKLGIQVKAIMVANLADLYSAANAIPEHTQGIIILRDNLIASGIGTLAKRAAQLKIPLITSDQGSIQQGGDFALSVHERDIGIAGAKLAHAVLTGKSVCQLPIHEMTDLVLFINKSASSQQKEILQRMAQQFNYHIELI